MPIIVCCCKKLGKDKEGFIKVMNVLNRKITNKVDDDFEKLTDKKIIKNGESVSLFCCEKTSKQLNNYVEEIERLTDLIEYWG